MTWSVHPEPSDETERQVLLAAVEQALAEAGGRSASYATPWWRAGLDDLADDSVDEAQCPSSNAAGVYCLEGH